jgi:hypothetical protein
MVMQIVKSIVTLAVFSTTASLVFSSERFAFWKAFIVCTMVQIIAYQIYTKLVEIFAEKLMNDRIKEYSKQGTEVTCPCSRAIKHFVPIQLNTNNSYKCLDCTKNIAVEVDVKTYLETVPMDLEKTGAAFDVVYNKATDQTDNGTNI